MARTFYQILGVDRSADEDTIDAAYRELAKTEHPDVSDHEAATKRFKLIQRARTVLTDEDERARYDRLGHDRYVRIEGNQELHDEFDDGGADDIQQAAADVVKNATPDDGSEETRSQTVFGGDHADPTAWTGPGFAEEAGPTNKGAAPGWREQERRWRSQTTETADWVFGGAGETRSGTDSQSGAARTSTADDTGNDQQAKRGSGVAWTAGQAESTAGETATQANRQQEHTRRTQHVGATTATSREGYAVKDQHTTTSQRSVLATDWDQESIGFFLFSFLLYPMMLISSVHPGFLLQINLIVGACTLFLMTYLLTRPGISVVLFGAWSFLLPVTLVAAGVPLLTPIGIVAVLGTWIPFAYSIAIGLALSEVY